MSASTEKLVEQIELTERAITEAESSGRDVRALRDDLKHLRRKLHACNEALNEGRQVLKD